MNKDMKSNYLDKPIDLEDPDLNSDLTEFEILGAITFYPPDEEVAVRLLRHIKRLEKRIEQLENG